MDDAHNHLQSPLLNDLAQSLTDWAPDLGIERMMVNGTTEDDWQAVAELATSHPSIIRPAFGLHPWYLDKRSTDWLDKLEEQLAAHPNATIGECGLDRWIDDHDIDDQQSVLHDHLALAVKLDRPVTIHCLKAWGPLLDVLQNADELPGGFLVHAFSGSREMAEQLIDLGAYFSFNGYFLRSNKESIRETYSLLSLERLLIETDAPSMPLPKKRNKFTLPDSEDGEPVNHPGNLVVVRDALAELRDIPVDSLDEQLDENFDRLFGS